MNKLRKFFKENFNFKNGSLTRHVTATRTSNVLEISRNLNIVFILLSGRKSLKQLQITPSCSTIIDLWVPLKSKLKSRTSLVAGFLDIKSLYELTPSLVLIETEGLLDTGSTGDRSKDNGVKGLATMDFLFAPKRTQISRLTKEVTKDIIFASCEILAEQKKALAAMTED